MKVNKTEQIIVRMTAKEKEMLQILAAEAELDVSKYVRNTLLIKLEKEFKYENDSDEQPID